MRFAILFIIGLFSSPVLAQQFFIIEGAPTGKMVLNCCDILGTDYAFLNYFLQANSIAAATAGQIWQSEVTANMLPSDTASLTQGFAGIVPVPNSYLVSGGAGGTSGHLILDWQGTQGTSGAPGLTLTTTAATLNNSSSVCGNSSQYVSGATTSTIKSHGASGCIEFSIDSPGARASIAFNFNAGAAFTGLTQVRLYRVADNAALQAGQVYNPDFLIALRVLKPQVIRTGDWSAMNGNLTSTASEPPLTALTYMNGYWNPAFWSGQASGTNTYSVSCTSTCTGGISGGFALQDGATLQMQFANANTSTTDSLAVNSGSVIPIVDASTLALTVGQIAANSFWTLIYDATLNEWLAKVGPVAGDVPTALLASLANQLDVGLWYNIFPHVNDNGTGEINILKANLNTGLPLYLEVGDEWWQNGQSVTFWAATRGNTLGFSATNNQNYNGFYALRFRQIMGNATTLWGARSGLHRVLANQSLADTSISTNYRIAGFNLCGTTCSNSTYQSAIGVDYNTAPNRPVDFADAISYATYYAGAILSAAAYSGTYAVGDLSACSVAGTNSGGMQCAADNYQLGTSASIAAAFAWMNNDIRQGTQNSVLGSNTLLGYSQGGGRYAVWNTVGTTYSLPMDLYEGGYQAQAPSVTQCGMISFPGTAATYCGPGGFIDVMLQAYKMSASFQQVVFDQFTQFNAGSPTNSMPSWYTFCYGTNVWSLCNGSLYGGWFTSYNAIQQFNFLLRRDIDPASNDNTPVGLAHAA